MSFNYIPLLKLKQNEIQALRSLNKDSLEKITPFFDIPRNLEDNSIDIIEQKLKRGCSEILKWWPREKKFYIDTFDLPTTFDSNGKNYYYNILNTMAAADLLPVPVIAFNRDPSHNKSALQFSIERNIKIIAVRLDRQDISDYFTFEQDINSTLPPDNDMVLDLILDLGVIQSDKDLRYSVDICREFIKDLDNAAVLKYRLLAISSSSIKKDFALPNREGTLPRYEYHIHNQEYAVKITYSDYGIVTPEYADEAIAPQLISRVSTPKVIYTGDSFYLFYRGGSFETHPSGRSQFFEISQKIVSTTTYRGSSFSEGDKFIQQKSNRIGSPSSQGHWYKMLNNAHFEFIIENLRSFLVRSN
ncbi:MAG: hypothetical protein VB958_03920 [Thalassolituus sp.]|uniref:beta family protein n=1 Tax=Thalassolituus sp. TaxID=2030822 RepID=UPI0039825C71